MTRSGGKKSNTKNLFSRGFRKHGPEPSTTYLKNFKIGDLVDIKINSSIHKGLPFKYYHGKTGKIFNITKSSVGVKILKTVGNRKILKKINVKIEHIKKSKVKFEFLERIKVKDFIRKLQNQFHKNIFFYPKKPVFHGEIQLVSFGKINAIDPEPYCVTV